MAMIIKHTIPNHPRFIDLTGQVFGELTVIGYAGRRPCGSQIKTMWWVRCSCGLRKRVHAQSLRTGHTTSCGRSHDVGYRALHTRLTTKYGSATEYDCVVPGCGPAAEWAYTNDDPNELTEINKGSLIRYSADLSRYQPMCSHHHRQFDADERRKRKTTCSKGHSLEKYEKQRRNGTRYCGECNRIRRRARKAEERALAR